jgi:hypothetical protein
MHGLCSWMDYAWIMMDYGWITTDDAWIMDGL